MFSMLYLDLARAHVTELEKAAQQNRLGRQARIGRRGGGGGNYWVLGSSWMGWHFRSVLRPPSGSQNLAPRTPACLPGSAGAPHG
jgi:hypothetical protein